MNPLQIHILAGAQAGARLQLNQSPVTFGRSSDCTLILDLPVVSRLHGELQIDEAGQWVLVNHSANGTRVGRKKATKKPIPLSDGAAINIGDTEVFRVFLPQPAEEDQPLAAGAPAAAAGDAQEGQPSKSAPGAGNKDRSKLWIGLGVWFALCIGAMLFFATLGGGDDDGDDRPAAAGFYYPGKEIDDMQGDEAGIEAISRLLKEDPPFEEPNASRYSTAVDRASRALSAGDLYESYRQYQIAIIYSDNREQPLSDLGDISRYSRVVEELSEIIYARYIDAFRAYHAGRFKEARQTLEQLRDRYYAVDDADDNLANHIRKLLNAAQRRSG